MSSDWAAEIDTRLTTHADSKTSRRSDIQTSANCERVHYQIVRGCLLSSRRVIGKHVADSVRTAVANMQGKDLAIIPKACLKAKRQTSARHRKNGRVDIKKRGRKRLNEPDEFKYCSAVFHTAFINACRRLPLPEHTTAGDKTLCRAGAWTNKRLKTRKS